MFSLMIRGGILPAETNIRVFKTFESKSILESVFVHSFVYLLAAFLTCGCLILFYPLQTSITDINSTDWCENILLLALWSLTECHWIVGTIRALFSVLKHILNTSLSQAIVPKCLKNVHHPLPLAPRPDAPLYWTRSSWSALRGWSQSTSG